MLVAAGGTYFFVSLKSVASEAITVEIADGVVRGALEGQTAVYRGIPYALPPVGKFRWRAPRAPESWGGVLEALDFGPVCPQPVRSSRPIDLPQDEDCLTLNVWAPANHNIPLPVMVWIHGGAFRLGSGSLPFYDGSALAKSGVVVVTFNYRLGKLGFFSHPALSQEHDLNYPEELEGNYGLLDQIAALRWVHKNISKFGGDPNNVTIFGESAGAVSVNYLMTSNLVEGLFNKAISQSGGGFQHARSLRKRDAHGRPSLEEEGSTWAGSIELPEGSGVDELKALPVETIVPQASIKNLGLGPVIDGRLILGDIGQRFERGEALNVPYIVGANNYEASLMKATGMSGDRIYEFFGSDKDRAIELYKSEGIENKEPLLNALYGDATFVAPSKYLADKSSSKNQLTWHYYFSYVPVKLRGKMPGAAHGSKIPFVFGSLSQLKAARLWLQRDDKEMSTVLLSYWSNFAKSGNPNGAGLPTWAPYNAIDRSTILIADEGIRVEKKLFERRLDFHIDRFDNALSPPLFLVE